MKAMQRRSPRPTSAFDGRGVLERRRALPGQGRLLDLERGRHQQPPVGRDAVARLDEHDVARHQLLGVDLDRHAVAPHAGDVLEHLLQRGQARLGLRLRRRPSTALKTVRPTSTSVVPASPVTTWLTTAAPTRMICMKSWYWRTKACSPDSAFLAASTLEPCSCRRRSTSAADSPRAGSTSRRVATSSGESWYQRATPSAVTTSYHSVSWRGRLDVAHP